MVFSCGRGDDGRLGHGDLLWQHKPKKIDAIANIRIRNIACGSYHTACVSCDGRLFTFGGGMYSKLGHPGEDFSAVPRPVAGLANKIVTAVACGSRHTLAMVLDPSAGSNGGLSVLRHISLYEYSLVLVCMRSSYAHV